VTFALAEFTVLLDVEDESVWDEGVCGTEGGAKGSSFASNNGVEGADITGEGIMYDCWCCVPVDCVNIEADVREGEPRWDCVCSRNAVCC